jgi:hypothetical protein
MAFIKVLLKLFLKYLVQRHFACVNMQAVSYFR